MVHIFLGKMQNGTVIVKNILTDFYKVKHTVTIRPSPPAPRHFPNRKENFWSYKALIYKCS